MPTLYSAFTGRSSELMSRVVAVTLAVTYIFSLVFLYSLTAIFFAPNARLKNRAVGRSKEP